MSWVRFGRRRMRLRAWEAKWPSSQIFLGQKLASSRSFQYAHRYSTGLSSGAYAGR